MKKQLNITTSLTALNLNAKETKIAEKMLGGVFQIPEKERVDILKQDFNLEEWGEEKIKKVKVKEIVVPLTFRRVDRKDNFRDLKEINKLDPPKVIHAKAVKKYFIMDGYRVFQFLKSKGESKIQVQVVGRAKSLAQISVARGSAVNVVNRPMRNLEMALGLHSLGEIIQLEFPDAFSKHGGNRKIKKKSLAGYIAQLLNIKESRVSALRNFAIHLGPSGLIAIQKSGEIYDLRLRDINSINAEIKEKDLPEMVEMLKIMSQEFGDGEKETNVGISEFATGIVMKEIEKVNGGFAGVLKGVDSTGKSSEKEKGKKGKPKKPSPTPKRKANFKKLHKLIDDFSRKLVEVKKIVPEKGRVSDFPSERIKKPFENLQRRFAELIMSMKKLME